MLTSDDVHEAVMDSGLKKVRAEDLEFHVRATACSEEEGPDTNRKAALQRTQLSKSFTQ